LRVQASARRQQSDEKECKFDFHGLTSGALSALPLALIGASGLRVENPSSPG
jgi:hypothetical protein